MNNYEKLISILREIFQIDQADLDFGIYRVMNQKREEINDFLENQLIPQVKTIIANANLGDASAIHKELEEAIKGAKALGVNPDDVPKVQTLKAQLSTTQPVELIEEEVFSHLASFFKRYYDKGDFISLRRYKKDVYAIPYEGEEVKLYWANHDQYYIKSSEYLKNYQFKVGKGRGVRFELVEASTEQNNNKAQNGKERQFRIFENKPLEVVDNNLVIYFTYLPSEKKVKREELNNLAFETVKKSLPSDWIVDVLQKVPTPKNVDRTLLQKHINDFTARNTFDYFIHKDLGGFLRRELDFYIKNEVLHIDDINTEDIKDFSRQLTKIKALKIIGQKVIIFLEQLENFQKRLWLKKKFVVETNYCITLDRIPESYYEEITKNETQWDEWERLFTISELPKNLFNGGGKADRLTILKQQSFLVLDTKFFNSGFKDQLLAEFENLEDEIDGLLINSENFQALELIKNRYKYQVDCAYIDPPYNTGNDDFIYKDNFQHSSWMSMLIDRVRSGNWLLKNEGTFAMSIDIKELDKSINLLDVVYGEENRKSNITIKRGSVTGAKVINPGVVNISENILMYSIKAKNWNPNKAFRKKHYDTRYNKFIINIEEEYGNWKFETVLDVFSKEKKIKKSQLRKKLGKKYEIQLTEYVIKNADQIVRFAGLDESSVGQSAIDAKKESLRPENRDKIFYIPRENKNDYYILNGDVLLFYRDRLVKIGKEKVPAEPVSDIWNDVLPNDLHNEGGVILRKGKKPEKLVHRVLDIGSKKEGLIIDYFLGSGTAAAVAQKTGRKWIGIDGGSYFRNIALRRMKNTLYGDYSGISKTMDWKGGGFFKYLRLESYEDTLNNLRLVPKKDSKALFKDNTFYEEYMLGYMLNTETKESLLSIKDFANPFNYQLTITENNESKPTMVDMVETFNYLVGLKVVTIKTIDGFRVVTGRKQTGEAALIIWRNTTEKNNEILVNFFKEYMATTTFSPQHIYINGDNTIANLQQESDTWKIYLTEKIFLQKMFDVQDV